MGNIKVSNERKFTVRLKRSVLTFDLVPPPLTVEEPQPLQPSTPGEIKGKNILILRKHIEGKNIAKKSQLCRIFRSMM